jgi:hypothetical protein
VTTCSPEGGRAGDQTLGYSLDGREPAMVPLGHRAPTLVDFEEMLVDNTKCLAWDNELDLKFTN